MVARDSAFFERTLADEFFSVTSDSAFGKRELVHGVATSQAAWRSWDTYRQYVRVFGNVGVVTGSLMAHGREGKQKLEEHWLYTQVFVKRAGRWQVVVGHYSRGE
jgi:ketosteroid isomerase-like protein